MAVAILGGLVSTTFLSLFVLPALYLRFASPRAPQLAPEDELMHRWAGVTPETAAAPAGANGDPVADRAAGGAGHRFGEGDRIVTKRSARMLSAGLVVTAALSFSACKEVEEESAAGYEPAHSRGGQGQGRGCQAGQVHARRVLTAPPFAPQRCGASGKHEVVPYESLIYNDEAKTFVYTSAKALEYERVPVTVDRIEGNRVFVSKGPAAGTEVVTVGATEVYGAELEIAGSH